MSDRMLLRSLAANVKLKVAPRAKDPHVPYVGLEHLVTDVPQIVGAAPANSSIGVNTVFEAEDILFGKLRPNLRKVANAAFFGYCSTDILVLRARKDVDSGYLGHLLRSREVLDFAAATAFGTKMPRTSWSLLGSQIVFAPALSAQRRIAEVLDTLDDQIRSTALLLSKLVTLRFALADDLLTVGVDGSGRARDCQERPAEFRETALGSRPREWSVAPLREFLDRSDYGVSSSLADTGQVPVLRMNNFADGEAKLDDLKYSDGADAARLTLSYGDVLFNRTNSMEHVGRTGIWRGQLDMVSFASYLVRLVPNRRLTNEYLNRLLNLRQTQIDLRRWATPGVHQVNVNPTNLRRVLVAVPDSVGEQDRICEALAAHDGWIERERRVLSKLRSQKAGLLGDLLTGRIGVPEEAAS